MEILEGGGTVVVHGSKEGKQNRRVCERKNKEKRKYGREEGQIKIVEKNKKRRKE